MPMSGFTISQAGKIRSYWIKEDNEFTLQVKVPGNCTATVFLPGANPEAIRESNCSIGEMAGVHQIEKGESISIIEIGSGSYSFKSKI